MNKQPIVTKVAISKEKRRRRRTPKTKEPVLDRNPGRRGDTSLSLTRNQFTATSPLQYFSVLPGSTPGGVRCKGRELVGALTLAIATTGIWTLGKITTWEGSTEGFLNLVPYAFPRLSSYSAIYNHFIFHKANCTFQSNQPTTAPGNFIMNANFDLNSYGSFNSTSSQMRNICSSMSNIYSDCSMQLLKDLAQFSKYECAGNVSPSVAAGIQAQITFGIEGFTGALGAAVGYLIIEYDVEFYTPQ